MTLPAVLALLGAALVLPLALGWALVGPARPLPDELAGALGLLGLAALLLSFLLSGRFRLLSGRIGIDRTMRWHQALGRLVLLALLAHPLLYTLPDGPAFLHPDDPTHAGALGLGGLATVTGWTALLLLGLLVITAIRRDDLPHRYEGWRGLHGLLAVAAALLGTHHALAAGRYSAAPAVAGALLGLLALALATLVVVWLLRPLLLARRPWRIAAVTPVALKTWELVLEPVGHPGLGFQAGQFAWIKLDRGPFARREHPFTIASAPSEPGRLRFLIKQAGDFTDRIGALPPGARAFVDGPHGALVLPGPEVPGIALLAGGVGVAPALAMLREAAAQGDARPFLLLYGNRLATQIAHAEELRTLEAGLRLTVVHVLGEPPEGWRGERGQLDANVIARHCAGPARAGWRFLLCGPAPMLREARAALRCLRVPPRRIRAERFTYD